MSTEKSSTKLVITGLVSFEHDITLGQAAQVIALIGAPDEAMGGGAPGGWTQPRHQAGRQHVPSGGLSSPREALEASGAKTNPERIVALALYVAQQSGQDTFTVDAIKPLFRQAREPIPGNISRDLDGAIKAGWVTETDTRGEFYVVGKAANVLESGFESLRGTRNSGTKPRAANGKTTRKPKEVPESFKGIDSFSASIDGYIDYHKITKQTDKFLWLINAAKLQGVASVSNQDIVWLSDHLGDGIPTGNISGNYRQNHKAGYVNRSLQDGKIRMMPAGEAYLKTLKA